MSRRTRIGRCTLVRLATILLGVTLGAPRVSAQRDTTYVLAIADRQWSRDSLTAGVELAAGGTAGRQDAAWRARIGASVSLGRVTASLHGVYGRIHLATDPTALQSLERASGVVPPAVPPRR